MTSQEFLNPFLEEQFDLKNNKLFVIYSLKKMEEINCNNVLQPIRSKF